MNNPPFKVMLVDDQAAGRTLIEMALVNHFKVVSVESGEQCIQRLKDERPDLVLLDVQMPGINGYETCRQIRSDALTKMLPVIFLSAQTDLQDKLDGYEAGGDDYLTKPVAIEEIQAKIIAVIDIRRKQNEILNQAQSIASMAISNAGEYGVVNGFVGQSFEAENFAQLAKAFLPALACFDLNCCLQIRGSSTTFEMATGGAPCKPIESELLSTLLKTGRIRSFGRRLMLNFDRISLLIKNMPEDDPDKCGRLKDHLALMMNAAESRVKSLSIAEDREREVLSRVGSALQGIEQALSNIEEDFSGRDHATTKIIDNLLTHMSDGFANLALTLEQEDYFIDLVSKHMEKVLELFYAGHSIDKRFHEITDSLHVIVLDKTLH